MKRGCNSSRLISNNCSFIHQVYPWYGDKPLKFLSDDTIRSRIEKFTGKRFINGLLFIEWITGDLRVIAKQMSLDVSRSGIFEFDHHGWDDDIFNDDRKYGSILTVENGLVVDFKEDRTNNPYGHSNIFQREREYEIAKYIRPYYVDTEPDTLVHKGRKYFFRRSPFSLKHGYTDVFHEDEVSIFNIRSDGGVLGMKGYHLTWVIRNDSLFISDIYPIYYDPKRPTLTKDTIISRMETFTGGRFINGLLFVSWVSGHFGVLTSHTRSLHSKKLYTNSSRTGYTDDRKYGGFIWIKNGLVIRFDEEDNRKIKN